MIFFVGINASERRNGRRDGIYANNLNKIIPGSPVPGMASPDKRILSGDEPGRFEARELDASPGLARRAGWILSSGN